MRKAFMLAAVLVLALGLVYAWADQTATDNNLKTKVETPRVVTPRTFSAATTVATEPIVNNDAALKAQQAEINAAEEAKRADEEAELAQKMMLQREAELAAQQAGEQAEVAEETQVETPSEFELLKMEAYKQGISVEELLKIRENIQVPPSEPGLTLAVGDDCTTPIIVSIPAALPYTDNAQTTCGRGNTYSTTCLGSFDGGEDIIYEVTVTSAVDIDIELAPAVSGEDCGVLIDDTCPPGGTGECIAFATSYSINPKIVNLHLEPGTYYIMADTYPSPTCFTFDLSITTWVPPTGACCVEEICVATNTEAECAALPGGFHSWDEGETCPEFVCPPEPWDCYDNPPTDKTGGGDIDTPSEPANDTPAGAALALVEHAYCGNLDASGVDNDDYYIVTLPAGPGPFYCLHVRLFADDTPNQYAFGGGLDPKIYIYAADGTTQLFYQDDENGVFPDAVHYDSQYDCLDAGNCFPAGTTLYIRATTYGAGPYLLVINALPCEPPTGRCCDYTDPEFPVCTIENEFDCSGPYDTWTEGGDCEGEPACPVLPLGRCCDYTTGPTTPVCTDTYEMLCQGADMVWDAGLNCIDDPCPVPNPGDNCDLPIVLTVADLPYTMVGETTCDRGNDYSNTCLDYYDADPDIMYSFTNDGAETFFLTIDVTNSTNSYIGMLIDDNCPPGGLGECIDMTTTSSLYELHLVDVPIGIGETVYIMVDSWLESGCPTRAYGIGSFDMSITGATAPPTGRCCDNSTTPPGCTDGVAEAACSGVDQVWTVDLDCTTPCPYVHDFNGTETFDVMSESFTNYTVGDPAGWQWSGTLGNPPGAAWHNDDNVTTLCDDYLVSNGAYTVPDLANIALYFDQSDVYAYGSYYVLHEVLISTDFVDNPSTATWAQLYEDDVTSQWETIIIDLTAYRGVPNVHFAFHYQGDWADEWHVDNVIVQQQPAGRCCNYDSGLDTPVCTPDLTLTACLAEGTDVLWSEGLNCIDDPCPLPPANDDCENAVAITTYPATGAGTTVRADVDCLAGWETVWYELTLPYTWNDITITVCPTTEELTNGGISLTTDCECGSYIDADSYTFPDCMTEGFTGLEMVFNNVYGGTRGTIMWPAYLVGAMGGTAFNYTINVVTAAAPPVTGDRCEDPFIITLDVDLEYTDTQDACTFTDNYGYGGEDVVYELTVAEPASATISLCNSVDTYDSYLRLWPGDDCGGTTIATDDDGCATIYVHGEIVTPLAAGTYYIGVDGWTGACGNYTLDVALSILPGTVDGVVTDAADAFLENVLVEVYDGVTLIGSDNTDVNGEYEVIDVPTGTYDIVFSLAGYYDAAEFGVDVLGGEASTVDMVMHVPATYSGTVTDLTPTPLEGVHVTVQAASVALGIGVPEIPTAETEKTIKQAIEVDESSARYAGNMPQAADVEYCQILTTNNQAWGGPGWFAGGEMYAVFQDPADCGLTQTYPFFVSGVRWAMIYDGAAPEDQSLAYQIMILDADMTDPGCPVPGTNVLYADTVKSFLFSPNDFWWIGNSVSCLVNGPYFIVVYFPNPQTSFVMPLEETLAGYCLSYNEWGSGWQDFAVSAWDLNLSNLWRSEGYSTAATGIVEETWTDVNGDYELVLNPGTYTVHFDTASPAYMPGELEAVLVYDEISVDNDIALGPYTIYGIEHTTDVGTSGCYPSPFVGNTVTVTGTVAGINQGTNPNYYLQDCVTTDWNGVYVYDNSQVGMAIGDNVTITANVSEYNGLTQLSSVSAFATNSPGNAICTLTVTSDDIGRICDPDNGVGENLENVLVRLENVTVLHGPDTYGQFWVKTEGATDSCQIDDTMYKYGTTDKPDTLVIGETYEFIIGIATYNNSEYEVLPRFASDVAALGYAYLPGDANMDGKNTGPDVTYLVQYFRSANAGCRMDGFFASADINGDCSVTGPDVTKLVNVFRSIGSIGYCEDWPPLWLTPGDVPVPLPDGFPFCDPPVLTGKTIIPTSSPK